MEIHSNEPTTSRSVSIIDQDDKGALRFAIDEAVLVPIASLSLADSPRTLAEDPEHLRLLAGTEARLPPILVHRPTMRVIDGRHRVAAARRRGEERIETRFFHGAESDAFVLAVTSNIAHGLPLSPADRRSAAARIIRTHSLWADRTIATVTGLSARTVADVRAGLGDAVRGPARLGRDGRVRPVNGGEGRRAAAALIEKSPDLSLRQVAQRVGISPETARDVRKRLSRGASPVPEQNRRSRAVPAEQEEPSALVVWKPDDGPSEPQGGRSSMVRRLRSEPAFRNSEDGRALLRLLLAHTSEIGQWNRMAERIPPHRGGTVAELALECSRLWEDFADKIERNAGTG
jgi:ParB-like chromosome segregation protein Spo0J